MSKVTVYTKNNCPACNMTVNILSSNNVEFTTINVDEDESALNYVKDELGFTSMPVVVSDKLDPFSGLQVGKLAKLK